MLVLIGGRIPRFRFIGNTPVPSAGTKEVCAYNNLANHPVNSTKMATAYELLSYHTEESLKAGYSNEIT